MRAARALYLTYFTALAALLPFLTLYYESAGLTGSQIGVLAGLMPLMMLVGAPLWAEFGDATRRYRLVLTASLGLSIVFALGLALAGSFVALALLVGLFAFSIAPVMPLVDHAVLEALGDRSHLYGRQRIWGAFGWGPAAPAIGWVVERYGIDWMFVIYAAVMALALLVARRIPMAADGVRRRFGSGIGTMMRDVRWLAFLFAAFVGGISLSVSLNFLPLYMRTIGADLTLVGLGIAAATVSELPILAFAGTLLVRLGARRILIAALLVYALRLALYPLITVPGWILAVQLLHGPTFAAMWIAGVAYAKRLAPPGAGAAAQGLFTGVGIGLSGFVGGLFGGFTYEFLGPRWMFALAAGLPMVGAAVLILATRDEVERPTRPVPLPARVAEEGTDGDAGHEHA
jgi:MFS transporter, PPP family, 3-phenylpropionic acid transporter